jgi:hypothetical protein
MIALSVATAVVSGCANPSAPSVATVATAPTPTASVALTIRVLARGSEQPIVTATAVVNGPMGTITGVTDATGQVVLGVPTTQSIDVNVAARGFIGFGASGTLMAPECWTFYLEQVP